MTVAGVLAVALSLAPIDLATAQTSKPTTAPGGGGAKKPDVKPDARGFTALGTVRFHPKKKEIEVDGRFNLRRGYLEYLACRPGVKSHETLVALDCDPVDLKVALLLLGLEEAKDPESIGDCRPLPGDRVMVFLRWETKDDAGKVTVHEKRAEDCIVNVLVEESMERCGWVFTGARDVEIPPPMQWDDDLEEGDVEEGEDQAGEKSDGDAEADEAKEPPKPKIVFGPTVTGELISMVHNPLCLLNNPLELPYDQGDYYADFEVLPSVPRDNPPKVTMIIRLPKKGEIDYGVKRMKVPPPPPGWEPPGGGEESGSDPDGGNADGSNLGGSNSGGDNSDDSNPDD